MAEKKKMPAKRGSRAVSTQRSIDPRRLILRENSPFMMKEAYKALRTNVAFSLPGSGAKCIGMTSSGRGEGKSYNSVNTAIAFAQIGKRVMLIDCDMRLPTVASKLGVRSKPGLSDLLVGEARLEEVVRRDVEGVDVMPAGSIPPDPTGLLESPEIERLLEQLRKVYDYIFIDLPPVNTVADATIISRCVDGFLLVVRHDKTENKEIAEMLRRMRMVGAKLLGFVYNDVPVDDKRYYKKAYYYAKA